MAAVGGGVGGGETPDCIVLDNGTGFVKAGYAGDNIPRHVFPSMVGRPTLRAEEDVIGDVELKDVMVGDEASAARRALEISYPMEEGKIKNWDDMEILWDYTFNDRLQTDTKGKRIVLTEPPGNPKASRHKVLQYMFEKYELDSVSLNVQAMLTLYGIGSVTGLVVDSGDGVTHIVCVADGYVPKHLVTRLDVAGRHVTEYLAKLMLLRGYAFNSTADFATVQEIKEKYCYVAKDPTQERKLALDTTVLLEKFKLPDGQDIKIERERFEAPEALFNPQLIDVERPGLSEMVF